MSLNDVQTELKSIKSNNCKTPDINKNTIENILENNVKRLEKFMDSKVINIYSRPWNKLETKLKKKKIEEYLNSELQSNTITLDTFNNLFYVLSRNIMLNEKIKLDYDIETCSITSFDYKPYL
jgi:hypothetical protein